MTFLTNPAAFDHPIPLRDITWFWKVLPSSSSRFSLLVGQGLASLALLDHGLSISSGTLGFIPLPLRCSDVHLVDSDISFHKQRRCGGTIRVAPLLPDGIRIDPTLGRLHRIDVSPLPPYRPVVHFSLSFVPCPFFFCHLLS